jgi:hypothetical protein
MNDEYVKNTTYVVSFEYFKQNDLGDSHFI